MILNIYIFKKKFWCLFIRIIYLQMLIVNYINKMVYHSHLYNLWWLYNNWYIVTQILFFYIKKPLYLYFFFFYSFFCFFISFLFIYIHLYKTNLFISIKYLNDGLVLYFVIMFVRFILLSIMIISIINPKL